MSVLLWVAVLVGAWCVASVVVALALGAYLRRRGEAAAARFEVLSRLDTGSLPLWFADIPQPRQPSDEPTVPDTPESLLHDAPAPRGPGDDAAAVRAERSPRPLR